MMIPHILKSDGVYWLFNTVSDVTKHVINEINPLLYSFLVLLLVIFRVDIYIFENSFAILKNK